MPKRSIEEKLHHYHKKIRKLEQKARHKGRDQISSSESDYQIDAEYDEAHIIPNDDAPIPEIVADIPISTNVETEQLESATTSETPRESELDPDILLALGEAGDDAPEFGENIHENLAQRWQPILKKGISKECKDNLFKEYRIPANCTLLQAPKLNPELSAAITDMTRNRDRKIESVQQQLGVGMAAINRAMSLLITSDDKIRAIKMLSDGCRILSDLHYMETQARTKMLMPGLDKSFVNLNKDTERDNQLFGATLSEKIKASRAIEKQGMQIKKTAIIPKASTPTTSTMPSRPRYQENWAGPSRYQPNRGGRGGLRRPFPATRKTAPVHQGKTPNQNKPRAASHQ